MNKEGEFKKRMNELTIQRKQKMDSMRDFYNRLPAINDVGLAMTEFKSHNDELIDYIIELESIWNKIEDAKKEFPKIRGTFNYRGERIRFVSPDEVENWFKKWFGSE